MGTLTIIQHNVNTWSNKRFELQNAYRKVDPDIILLNHIGTPAEPIRMRDYDVYTSNEENSTHRGTAIAVKKTIKHEIIDGYDDDLMVLKIHTRLGPIIIATDYISPSAECINYYDYNYLMKRKDPVYFIGDINARSSILGHRNNNVVGRSVAHLIELGLAKRHYCGFPTYIGYNASSNPDIMLSNKAAYHNVHLEPGPQTTSDHVPLVVKVSTNPIAIPIEPRKQFTHANWTNYREELQQHPPISLTSTDQIDIETTTWMEQVKDAADHSIPDTRNRVLPGLQLDDETRRLTTELDTTYAQICLLGHRPELYRRLKYLQGRIKREYMRLRREADNRMVDRIDCESDPNRFWKSMKKFSDKSHKEMTYLRDNDNQKVNNPEDKEKLMREHWSQIYKIQPEDSHVQAKTHHDNVVLHCWNRRAEHYRHSTIDMTRLGPGCPPMQYEELEELIRATQHKAPGFSGINAHLMKQLPENMIQNLLKIFNSCLATGHFPKPFKEAKMIFIPKEHALQHKITGYRPISLLEVPGKILEKAINRRFEDHLTANDLRNPRQHGFRFERGTHTALATIHERIAIGKDNGGIADIVLRDVSKAFDKVWHTGLRYKLLNIDPPLHPCLFKILSNYLSQRTARIQIAKEPGEPFPLECGVPQGGCLSPTLYTFYNSDMPAPIPNEEQVAYADDLTQIITYPSKSFRMLACKTNEAISRMNNYERQWKIKTNMKKFTLIPLFRDGTMDIYFEHEKLNYSTNGKVLGLKIGKQGLGSHVTERIRIARAKLAQLAPLRNLSTANKLRLYKSTIRPTLTYPAVPMNTLSNSLMKKLQVVQNDSIRFIINARRADRINMRRQHQELQLEPVNIFIHRQATKTWETVGNTPPLDSSTRHDYRSATRSNFRSSRALAEGPEPSPIFTSAG